MDRNTLIIVALGGIVYYVTRPTSVKISSIGPGNITPIGPGNITPLQPAFVPIAPLVPPPLRPLTGPIKPTKGLQPSSDCIATSSFFSKDPGFVPNGQKPLCMTDFPGLKWFPINATQALCTKYMGSDSVPTYYPAWTCNGCSYGGEGPISLLLQGYI